MAMARRRAVERVGLVMRSKVAGNQTETCEEKPFDFEQAGICDVVGEFHLVGFERLDAKAEELAFVGEVEVDFGGLEFS